MLILIQHVVVATLYSKPSQSFDAGICDECR